MLGIKLFFQCFKAIDQHIKMWSLSEQTIRDSTHELVGAYHKNNQRPDFMLRHTPPLDYL